MHHKKHSLRPTAQRKFFCELAHKGRCSSCVRLLKASTRREASNELQFQQQLIVSHGIRDVLLQAATQREVHCQPQCKASLCVRHNTKESFLWDTIQAPHCEPRRKASLNVRYDTKEYSLRPTAQRKFCCETAHRRSLLLLRVLMESYYTKESF